MSSNKQEIRTAEEILDDHIGQPGAYAKEEYNWILSAMLEYASQFREKGIMEQAAEQDSPSLVSHSCTSSSAMEQKLRDSLEDLYNALNSIPKHKKKGTLAEVCDMELAKELIGQSNR
jgi:hypothetical protein